MPALFAIIWRLCNVATIYTHPMAQGGSGNGHYGGKAEVYMDVGEAMGKAMVELLKNKK